jgi:hypothetical protein
MEHLEILFYTQIFHWCENALAYLQQWLRKGFIKLTPGHGEEQTMVEGVSKNLEEVKFVNTMLREQP